MGMFGEAAGSILRSSKCFGIAAAGTEVMHISAEQVEAVLNQCQHVTLRARDLVAGRTQAELITSLESESWSVAQCLDHLTQTTNAFIPALSSGIARAPRLTTDRALRTGALTRLFILNLEPPYRLRLKVLAPLVPRRRDFNAAWAGFEESQAQLARTIQSASGLAIDRVRVESPVYARFSYSVYGALRMLTAHQRRHLWQMEQILKAFKGSDSTAPAN
jgi:hypothetical protein